MFRPICHNINDCVNFGASFLFDKIESLGHIGSKYIIKASCKYESGFILNKPIFSCMKSEQSGAFVINNLSLIGNCSISHTLLHTLSGCLLIDLAKKAASGKNDMMFVITDVEVMCEWFVDIGYDVRRPDDKFRGFGSIDSILSIIKRAQ